jgi:RHS repeat-associated protein
MKKYAIILLACIFAFPTVTRTALIQTELTYNVRNAKGIYSFGTYLPGAGQVNLANGNLVFGRTLAGRPGRAGFNADISLVYNSKIWDRSGNYMTIPEAGSYVGLGWRIGFSKLIQGSSSYAVIGSDGASHEIVDFGSGVWKSVDSTYILFSPASKTATLPNGTKLIFANTLGNTSYLTEMKDRNGNQIKVTYVSGTGKISQVQDTVGVLANFAYSGDGMLQSIQSHGTMKADILFEYQSFSPGSWFSLPIQLSQTEKTLSKVTIKWGNGEIRQLYVYFGGCGELSSITNVVVDRIWDENTGTYYDGTPTNSPLAYYQYATANFYDATYGSVQERMVTNVQDGYNTKADGTYSSAKTHGISYTVDQTKSSPSLVTVLDYDSYSVPGMSYNNNFSQSFSTFNFTNNGRNWSDGLIQSVVKKSDPYVTPQVTLRTYETTWTQDNPSLSFIDNPNPTSQTETLENGQYTHKDFTYTTDGSGRIRQVSEYGFAGELMRRTTTNYLYESNPNYAALNLIALPSSVSIADSNGIEVARTEYVYDAYPLTGYGTILNQDPAYGTSFLTRGNVTDVRRLLKESSRYVSSSTRYDVAGNAVSATDARGNTATTVFSSDNHYAYPVSVSNALNHVSSFTYWTYTDSNYVSFINGDLKTVTDPNGVLVSSLWYDYLGRKTQETTPTETKNFSYDDLNFLATSYSSSGWGYSTSNSAGNGVNAQQSDPAGQNIEQTANYNPSGQVVSGTPPHRYGSGGGSFSNQYDVLGRMKLAISPSNGQTGYQYVGNTTTVTDGDGKVKKYTYNGFGKVSKVTEPDSQGNLTQDTIYSYDTLGRLIQITQGSQTRSFVYDSLGRLLSETHPESGTGTYTYDDNGNLLTRTDARGVTTTSVYDALNRNTTKTYSDGTPSATYSYDETTSSLIGLITNGKGRQTSAWTSDGIGYSWKYDSVGRATQQVYRIDNTNYPVSYNYTEAGCGCPKSSLLNMTYPNGMQVDYTRDSIGRLTSIGSTVSGQPYYDIQSIAYDSPSGAVSRLSYTSVEKQDFGYDSSGRIGSIRMYGANFDVNWTYGYSYAGRIGGVTENAWSYSYGTQSSVLAYGFDNVGRISSAVKSDIPTQGTVWSANYSYDRYNNMLSKTGTTFSVNSANNRLTNLTYDSAGNVISDGSKSYSYNALGKVSQVNSGQLAAYRYDALGRQVKKTYLYNNAWGQVSGTIIYVYGVSGEILAEYKNETTYWGTETSTTNNVVNGGQIVSQRKTGIDPWGSINSLTQLRRNHLGEVAAWGSSSFRGYPQPFTSGGSDQFPGQKDNPETGLNDFGARNYNPTTVRWMAADSVTGHIYDPQSLNKYTYVRNDPVNLVDPDGRISVPVDPINIEGDLGDAMSIPPMPSNSYDHQAGTKKGWDDTHTPAWQRQWNALSAKCKNGLTTAMDGDGDWAIKSRIGALNRALGAKDMLQALTVGSVIDWEMLAAIGIRESHFQNKMGDRIPDSNGVLHWGRGIFQIDSQHSEVSDTQAFDATWAAGWAFSRLKTNYALLLPKSGNFDSDQFKQALAASYNIGAGGISGDPTKIDKGTWNGNYGSNIVDLMDCFK